jgi:hypothetical protein
VTATYRAGVDQQTREEIAAAGAAHRELGPGYDDAVAEGLVERISAEIDRRVDARLAQHGGQPTQHVPPKPHAGPPAQRAPGGQVSHPASHPWPAILLALGSMTIGGITAAAVIHSNGSAALAAFIWIIIGVINVAYVRRH